jgi:hypothetical protein
MHKCVPNSKNIVSCAVNDFQSVAVLSSVDKSIICGSECQKQRRGYVVLVQGKLRTADRRYLE